MNIKEELIKLKNKITGVKQKHSNTEKTTVLKPELTEEEKRMLEDVHKFRERYTSPAAEATANHFASIRNISLDAKVDDYIQWNYENMIKGIYTDIGEYWIPIELRNFIEKLTKQKVLALLSFVNNIKLEDDNYSDYNLCFSDLDLVIKEELDNFKEMKEI